MAYDFDTKEFADISSRHFRQGDLERLETLSSAGKPDTDERLWHVNLYVVAKHPDLWFVALGNDFSERDKAYLVEVGFSPEFAEMMWQLTQQRIFYVRIDIEGYEVEGAPLFE